MCECVLSFFLIFSEHHANSASSDVIAHTKVILIFHNKDSNDITLEKKPVTNKKYNESPLPLEEKKKLRTRIAEYFIFFQ